MALSFIASDLLEGFLMPTVGYKEGYPSQQTAQFDFVEQTREAYYKQTHIQAIKFQIARLILERLMSAYMNGYRCEKQGAETAIPPSAFSPSLSLCR